jgi:Asp-tRNA(Asn)/Glu-tRNA(Gln) amidotransferase A subunit family amidase
MPTGLSGSERDGLSLAELAGNVRAGRVAPEELVASSQVRIDSMNGGLNAVVARCDEEALARAGEMAGRIAAGEDPGPLAGLPLLVKDTDDAAGMVTTHGSLMHANDPPALHDGLVVGRLRAAGAIVVGKTNVPEFAFEGFTSNRVFGSTRNPWAADRSPGGSSGGSGAALAAGLAAIATASDGGGSVRIPAGFCGLAGLKPTNGVIGRGTIPAWIDFSTKGPLATSIADLRLLLSVMAGPAAGDPTALPAWANEPEPSSLPGRVFAARRLVAWGPLPPSISDLFDAALRRLESGLGLEVVPLEPHEIFRVGNIDEDWLTIAATEHAQSIGRATIEANAPSYSDEFLAAVQTGLGYTLEEYMAARARRFDYVRELDSLLGEDGLLLTPTMCAEGWSAEGYLPGAIHAGTPGDAYNCQAANVTGNPALSVPAGRAPNGVPFGLQIMGPRFRDRLVLALGEAWERISPWALSAPGYEPFGP